MSALYTTESFPPGPLPAEADIVIVGAGMAGLYVAWRLLREDPNRSICILERTNRIGGRLDSDIVKFPDGSEVKEEQGGMRFTFDTMDDLMSLLLILGLDKQIVPFPMSSGGNNRLYFRGHALTNAEAEADNYAIWSELYDLDQSEQGIDPRSIITAVFQRILAANPDFKPSAKPRTPEYWQAFRLDCKWNGETLNNWSLWNLLADMGYSNECVTLLYRILGFNGTFLSQMNVGAAFQLLGDFGADTQFFTLLKGFSELPNRLAEAVGKERIHLLTTVDSISVREDGGYELLTHCTETLPETNTIAGAEHSIVAKEKVVLALPRLALEKLFLRSNAFDELEPKRVEDLWNTLQKTTQQPLLKINLYYNEAWWGRRLSGRPPVAFGPNFSDLPLGSVYPFYSINDESLFASIEYRNCLKKQGKEVPDDIKKQIKKIDKAKYERPAALTIYCDFLNINFWRALQGNGPCFESPPQGDPSDEGSKSFYPASKAVVREATRLFKQLFNTHYVPDPVLSTARIWAGTAELDVPLSRLVGFGVHQWGLHADDRIVMEDLIEPVPGIYTCGEAFSDYQGWVEGALRSADKVLARFGLKPISEVYKDEDEHRTPSSEAIRKKYAEHAAERIRKHLDRYFEPCEDVYGAVALDEGYDFRLYDLDR